MTKDLNILAAEVHAAAKAKGFWESSNDGEKLMLIISELSEALEAHRSGRFARAHFKKLDGLPDEGYQEIFRLCVKDTFEDELADVVIRILDFCGAMGVNVVVDEVPTGYRVDERNIGELFFAVTKVIVNGNSFGDYGGSLCCVIETLLALSAHMNIDLWKHIELKFKYNASRPHKHGKAY